MDIHKDFAQRLRRKEFEEVYIFLSEDITHRLKEYVRLLTEVEFIDGQYHTYYGNMKKIIASFVVFCSSVIDDVIKETDRYLNILDKDDINFLMERTIAIHQNNQDEFEKSFLPVKTSEEEQIYEEVQREYESFMDKVYDFKAKIDKLKKKEDIMNFAKEHFRLALVNISEMLHFTHSYLALMLADYLPKIRVSLEGIYHRMCVNLRNLQEDHEAAINRLLNKLYDKNKEKYEISRKSNIHKRHSMDIAEVELAIGNLTAKIENLETETPLLRLHKEVAYWKKRTEDFHEIFNNLSKLKTAKDEVVREENKYSSGMEELIRRRKHIEQLIRGESKTLVSFFAIKGTDRIFYTDNVGPYYVDEHNHQVYVFDHGLGIYHINCKGEFQEFPEEAYLYDSFGRYFIRDGQKIYQCAPCTSHYNLVEHNLFKKITKDCGHSERINKVCRMFIKDHTKAELLPDFEPIDIRRTLDSETVKYLWDSFGSLLPEALHDVGIARPKNPIHFLAHKLIYHKYRRSPAELEELKRNSEKYHADLFKKQQEKQIAAAKKWKSKQIKRRKPEESDDSETRAVYDAHVAEQIFINSLNYFNE